MKKRNKSLLVIATIAAAGAGAVLAWPIGKPEPVIRLTGDAGRGAYLARASGCITCHTDFAKDGAPLAGGVEIKTPFGPMFSPNITTDPLTGIGSWTQEQFAKAVRQGISPMGQPYYPAFPYAFYASFTDQEIADLWAAFQTLPAVAQPSKPHGLGFPFNQRAGLKLWRAVYLEPPATSPVPENGDLWNRGRLLVEGAGHCAACHTGRNLVGARKSGTERFQGNPDLPDGSKAPAIDAKTLKMRGWDVTNLSYALQTGVMPDGDAFGGSMGKVVLYGTSFLTRQDRDAIATYLLDIHEGG